LVVQLHELFGPTTDSHELAEQRRRAIIEDQEFAALPSLAKAVTRLRDDDLFARLTRYLDFENAEKTSNHVERENREFRKRQKGHYRFRSRCSLGALLDLLAARHPIPLKPVRLVRKTGGTPAEEEVRRAA
jgi:chromatin segregation and condensation protein Rec8/ScpA/Scc1 (kleisin family)